MTLPSGTARQGAELPGKADVDGAAPVGRVDLVDAAGRSRDAGVVDQRIEAAEIGLGGDEHPVDIALVGDVGFDPADLGIVVAERVEHGVGHVADDARTVGQEPARDARPMPPAPAVTSTRWPAMPAARSGEISVSVTPHPPRRRRTCRRPRRDW